MNEEKGFWIAISYSKFHSSFWKSLLKNVKRGTEKAKNYLSYQWANSGNRQKFAGLKGFDVQEACNKHIEAICIAIFRAWSVLCFTFLLRLQKIQSEPGIWCVSQRNHHRFCRANFLAFCLTNSISLVTHPFIATTYHNSFFNAAKYLIAMIHVEQVSVLERAISNHHISLSLRSRLRLFAIATYALSIIGSNNWLKRPL